MLLDVDETLLDALHHFFTVHAPLQVIREDYLSMAVSIHIKLDLGVDEILVHQPQQLAYYFSRTILTFMSRLSHKWRQIRILITFIVLILLTSFLDGQML